MPYKCEECGKTFDEPVIIKRETVEYFGTPCNEEILVSPCCHEIYVELEPCKCCHELYDPFDLNSEGLCEECEHSIEDGETIIWP